MSVWYGKERINKKKFALLPTGRYKPIPIIIRFVECGKLGASVCSALVLNCLRLWTLYYAYYLFSTFFGPVNVLVYTRTIENCRPHSHILQKAQQRIHVAYGGVFVRPHYYSYWQGAHLLTTH